MAYEAPKVTEAGKFSALTLGSPNEQLMRDSNVWFDFLGPAASR